MDSDCVSVRVYVMDEENEIDVHRFVILKKSTATYENLCYRIQSSMPERVFKLYWIDSEGDEITISTNDEILVALSELKETDCMFVIRLEPIEIADDYYDPTELVPVIIDFLRTSYFSQQLHAQVSAPIVCNTCSNPINSTSFKCLECPNYYQCQHCDEKDTHPNHIMQRVHQLWAEEQKAHFAYSMDLQEHQTIDELRQKLKFYEDEYYKFSTRHSNRKTPPTPGVPRVGGAFANEQFGGLCTLINAFKGFISNVSNEYKKESAVKANELVDEPLEDSWLEDAACALSPSFGAAATNGFTSKPSNESNDDATPSFNEWLVDEPPDKSWFQDEARALSPSSGAAAPPEFTSNPTNESDEDTTRSINDNEWLDHEPPDESWSQDEARALPPSTGAAAPNGYISKEETAHSYYANEVDNGPPVETGWQDEARALSPSIGVTVTNDSRMKLALDLLEEMGFGDEARWLRRMLQYWNWDLAATLYHLAWKKFNYKF